MMKSVEGEFDSKRNSTGISASFIAKSVLFGLLFLVLLGAFFIVSRYKYLVFHTFIETFSVVISCCVYVVSTFTFNKEKNAFSILGFGYLIVGVIDLLHTLSYQGMNIFSSDMFYANQLWICARFIESITIFLFLTQLKKLKIDFILIVFFYLAALTVILLSVFYFRSFPVCFVKGQGQTAFKIIGEYFICLFLGMSFIYLKAKRLIDNKKIETYFSISIIVTILSEISFTLYTDNYGLLNVVGHLLKLVSFYFIYKSILIVNVQNPLAIIFEELNYKEKKIEKLLAALEIEKNDAVISSYTDSLTGMYNRRYFDERAVENYRRARREKKEFSLLMADIDFFKNYNDYYGHVLGDACLKNVAKALQGSLTRSTDLVARYGGEEFVAVLENTGISGALVVANRMKDAVYELGIEHLKSECGKNITISIGVVTLTEFGPESAMYTVDEIVSFADSALYKAKASGRNRVALHMAEKNPE